MREILFRGKRLDNGEWVKGYYIKATHHWHNHGIHEDWIAVDTIQNGGWCNVRGKYAVIPETVGQYTGLTDKNGTKIFEGDVVSFKRVNALGLTTSRVGDVRYYDELPIFYIMATTGDAWDWCECEQIEVIGNIHDNPELL